MKAQPRNTRLVECFIKTLKSKDIQKSLFELSHFLSVVNNKNREEILQLLKKEGDLTITEIADKVGLAYKNVHAHIKKLLSVDLITTEKQEKTRGRKVLVKLTDTTKKNI
jgi:predicted transcriptional regulator